MMNIFSGANEAKMWDFEDINADHTSVWSSGGPTIITNCEILCKPHNKAKCNK